MSQGTELEPEPVTANPNRGAVTSFHRATKGFAGGSYFTRALEWGINDKKMIILCFSIFISCYVLLILLIFVELYASKAAAHGTINQFSDFFALWSYQEITKTHPISDLYNSITLHVQQLAMGMDDKRDAPFPYPPIFLIITWPLGVLPYYYSYFFWIAGTLALFAYAVFKTCSRSPFIVGCAIVAPVSMVNIFAGQSGFLSGALLTAGIRLAATRPVISGILLGTLSFKPQLGLLAPLALAAAGLWRTFAAACATGVALAIIATMMFGADVWSDWIANLPRYSEWFDQVDKLRARATVLDNLHMLGVSMTLAETIQALVAAVVAALIWLSFRRGSTPLANAALLTGVFLVTPHAFVYDTPMVVASMALFIEARRQTSSVFSLGEISILLASFLYPLLIQGTQLLFPATLPLILLFGMIINEDLACKYKQ